MAKYDIYELQFLESAENVRRVIHDTYGREPNAKVAKDVSVCIQQGRMFFESASTAAMEIRPLLLYYGMVAFAKAVVAARTLRPLSSLHQGHGLGDISSANSRISELVFEIRASGTFQEFNDVVCKSEGLEYYGQEAMRKTLELPTAASDQLIDTKITLKDVLARLPRLENLYHATFNENAALLPFQLHISGHIEGLVELRVDLPDLFEDLDSLRQIVADVRTKHPDLQHWRFRSAEKAWNNSIITFCNMTPMQNEFFFENLIESGGGKTFQVKEMTSGAFIDFRTLLKSVNGDLKKGNPYYFVAPVCGKLISDVSLKYAGMFLLSSLVRYRPLIWVHSVSRYSSQDNPADDQALALIEKFMNNVQRGFPNIVLRLLTQA